MRPKARECSFKGQRSQRNLDKINKELVCKDLNEIGSQERRQGE